MLALSATPARADVSEFGTLTLLAFFVGGPLALLYLLSHVARRVVHDRHRKFAGTLVVALPASYYVFDTLRPLEPPFSWPKLLLAAVCTLGPVIYVAVHALRRRRE